MNKQIVVNIKDFEINAGVLEDGKLTEYFVERNEDSRIVGNIYKGKVENVLPGMESAFVNIGLEKNSFLYVNDLREFEEKFLDGIENSDKPIEDILNVGDEVIVQILKEPRGTKGARVTTHYTIPGKYLVLMPNNDYIGISKKIKNEEERERLQTILSEIKPEGVGVIIRTVAEGKDAVYFEREIEYLVKKWQEIESKIKKAAIGEILYQDNNLLKRVIRDIFSSDVDELIIDSEEKYWKIMDYIAAFAEKGRSTKIKLYSDDEPILRNYGIEKELKQALESVVWLDCGGYLVIEKTEALISIDVNTGKNTGIHNLEETVFQTNLEAAMEIPRQLRLRNLSGIIIIDFIDMKLEEDKKMVIEELEKNLSLDRIKNNVIHFTDLGLVEMTRKRVGKPLSNFFLEPCAKCGGSGYVESSEATVHEVIEQIKVDAEEKDIKKIKLMATEKLYDKIQKLYKGFIESYLREKDKEFEIEKIEIQNHKLYEIFLKNNWGDCMKVAVYAGSFDPITKGHLDIINRSAKLFDKLIVAILNNSNKKYWFNLEERKEMIAKCILPEQANIEIKSFEGLLVNFMEENNADVLVRGLRAVSDYEYELQLALTNSVLATTPIETIFLTASRENLYLSASIVKDVALNNGRLEEFLSEKVIPDVEKRAKSLRDN